MPRKRKKAQEVTETPVTESPSVDETPVSESTPNETSEQRETYEMPGQDVEKLNARADDFLKREEDRKKANEPKSLAVRSETGVSKQEKKNLPAKSASKSPSSGVSTGKKRSEYSILIGAGIAVIALIAGVFIGTSLMPQSHSHPQVVKETVSAQSGTNPTLALHNPVSKDSMYGVTMQVTGMQRRIDGLYVTFKVTNQSPENVYFMANTMKMRTTDGHLFLPEVGHGNIPSTFEAAGLPPGTSDEATVVFAVPQNAQPSDFILDNVTNLQNGSWDFDIPVQVQK